MLWFFWELGVLNRMDAVAWAHEQFWGCSLPDLRLKRRLVEVAACIRNNPCGTLPRAVRGAAALKGAYRLFMHSGVSHPAVVRAHVERTRQACHKPGQYLLIEDTTSLCFTQRAAIRGMGPLTKEGSQGVLAHTCLAVRVEQWNAAQEPEVTLAGVFGQECWVREIAQGTRKERKKVKRKKATTSCPRESDRWARALRQTSGPPQGAQWTLVADRECDIFEVMMQCAGQSADWIIRAAQPRKTLPLEQSVFEAVARAPVQGTYTIPLRARPGVAARDARVELRAVATALRPPRELQARCAPLQTGLVEVREIDPPTDADPIHWLLLTSWPCATCEQIRRVVRGYACRWLIEEYHKALKTGTNIEDSQLSTAERIQVLLAIHAVVAAELLQLKLLANARPDEAIRPDMLTPESIAVLEITYGRPATGWTNRNAMTTIARMGGYLARRHDGPPGWLSIWRGYLKLQTMAEGYALAISLKNYG